jgi:VIT1/CCC1 family predicted Fe2+/Mn2+ transporter
MPTTEHIERHFTGSALVRDIVIGMSDGLTVPFALAAGLSGAAQAGLIKPQAIVIAGLAEIAAGSIAMGLGGYLAARSDAEHYESELGREKREVIEIPDEEAKEVSQVFQCYGMTAEEAEPVVTALRQRPKDWVDFMMRFELGLEKPDPKRAVHSAGTISASYIAGGLIPLSPYIIVPLLSAANAVKQAELGLAISALVTLIALGIFGYVKGRFTGTRPLRSALQTVVIGGLAATAAFILARLIS